MPKFNPPEAMPFDAPSQWPEWRERYRIATRLHKDDGDIQVSSLIYAMGRQAEFFLNHSDLNFVNRHTLILLQSTLKTILILC